MFGMNSKNKAILALLDKYTLGWPCRDSVVLNSLLIPDTEEVMARLKHHEVLSQEILLCQQRSACVKTTTVFNWLSTEQIAKLLLTVCDRYLPGLHQN